MSVTTQQVLRYIADSAESVIEDDTNEAGMPGAEFAELHSRAMTLIKSIQRADNANGALRRALEGP